MLPERLRLWPPTGWASPDISFFWLLLSPPSRWRPCGSPLGAGNSSPMIVRPAIHPRVL